MLYRLFLYGTEAARVDAMAIKIIDHAIESNSVSAWENGNDPADFLKEFDMDAVVDQIEKALGNKCKARVVYPPKKQKQIAYLFLATSYREIHRVLPQLHAIAEEHDLALYDAEKRKCYYRELVDKPFITLKLREQEIKERILSENKPIWEYSQLSYSEDWNDRNSSFIVTIRKTPDVSFLERTRRFYQTLVDALAKDEELVCDNRCFTVKGPNYSMTFCLEGYKKHPNQVGYYENGQIQTELLHRMGCTEAIRWRRNQYKSDSRKWKAPSDERMIFREMVERYPNPADRYVHSVKISKHLKKIPFDVYYYGIGPYGSDVIFHIAPEEYSSDESHISVLSIEEESASFILPFIADIYPFVYERYYLTPNHIPTEMWDKFIERILQAKDMVLHDTFNSQLQPYMKRFNLFVLSDVSAPDYYESEEYSRIKNQPQQFLYEHRYEVAHLYDIFIEWSRVQLETYSSECMFNIQGP